MGKFLVCATYLANKANFHSDFEKGSKNATEFRKLFWEILLRNSFGFFPLRGGPG